MKQARFRAPDPIRAEAALRELLDALGFDPEDPTLATTPRTAVHALSNRMLDGYKTTPEEALGRGFPVNGRGAVIASHIPLFFLCPHHLLPATGEAHVAFLPRARVPGLGRIARLVDALAHRLVLQEDLTEGVVNALRSCFDVEAAVAIVEARHLCVAIDDFARRDATFRTRAAVGARSAISSLDAEIDATLRSTWPTHTSPPQFDPPTSKSRSRSRRTSVETPAKPTVSRPRRRSRSDAS